MGGRGGAGPRKGGESNAISRERMLQDLNAFMREQNGLGLEQQIQQAYRDLAPESGDWVSLADIRDRVSVRFTRQQVDDALRGLEQLRSVNIVPQANQKALSQRNRDGAVVIGRQEKHFIAMDL